MQIIHSISSYMNSKQIHTENARKAMPMKLDLESQDPNPSRFICGGVLCHGTCESKVSPPQNGNIHCKISYRKLDKRSTLTTVNFTYDLIPLIKI